MKKLLLLFALIGFSTYSNAQAELYFKVRELIQLQYPAIDLEGKLIAINIWSLDNQESREANKSFEKAFQVYEGAKLKGGNKGIVVIAVNRDNLSSVADIAFKKDGLQKLLSFKIEDIRDLEKAGFSNIVFDANGLTVYTDLKAPVIFSSINSLITR